MREIKQAFLNVPMGNRFDGLCEIAKKAGIKLSELSPDSYLIFVNASRDKIAMLVGPQIPGQKQTMAYVRLAGGRKVDLRAIKEIPRAFNGKSINYDAALGVAIEKALAKKGSQITEYVSKPGG